jgi:hypothetical protein
MSQTGTKGVLRVNLKEERILSKSDVWWELRWQRARARAEMRAGLGFESPQMHFFTQ